jgi:two-component sensor histidine kinase
MVNPPVEAVVTYQNGGRTDQPASTMDMDSYLLTSAAPSAAAGRPVDLGEQDSAALAQMSLGTVDGLQPGVEQPDIELPHRGPDLDRSWPWLAGAFGLVLAVAAIAAYLRISRGQQQVGELARRVDRLRAENALLSTDLLERTQALVAERERADRVQQRVERLSQDASHRIGNSLATISSLLGLQLLRSQSDEVRVALEAARSRVHAIAAVHRRLRPAGAFESAKADEFLAAVLEEVDAAYGAADRIRLRGRYEPIVVRARDATTLGLLVGELVNNAVRHGFPGERSGAVTVELLRDAAGVPVLSVVDDGIGLPEGQQSTKGGLGSVIVKQLATQLSTEPNYEQRAGGGVSVSMPLPGIEAID